MAALATPSCEPVPRPSLHVIPMCVCGARSLCVGIAMGQGSMNGPLCWWWGAERCSPACAVGSLHRVDCVGGGVQRGVVQLEWACAVGSLHRVDCVGGEVQRGVVQLEWACAVGSYR